MSSDSPCTAHCNGSPGGVRRSLRRRSQGATLVDLVITVLIMGILAAAAAPKFASVTAKLRCEAVARRIASDLNFARRSAMQTSRQATVSFRSAPAGYDMTAVVDPANPFRNYSVTLADVDSGVLLTGYNFGGGASAISYNCYGLPLVGASPLTSGTITVASGGHSLTVTISPTTGEASTP